MLGRLIQLSLGTHLETLENRDNMGVFGFLFRFCKPKTHTHTHMLGLQSILSLSLTVCYGGRLESFLSSGSLGSSIS